MVPQAAKGMDPLMHALLYNTQFCAGTDMNLHFARSGSPSNSDAITPSRSYSNKRSSSGRTCTDRVCQLPYLARSSSASARASMGTGEHANKMIANICTSSGRHINSVQKHSIFDDLNTGDNNMSARCGDQKLHLPAIGLGAARRARSNPELQKSTLLTYDAEKQRPAMKVYVNSDMAEQRHYPIEFRSNPNQIVFGYSMSPHPERTGGVRRAHCPIGDRICDM